MEHFPIVLALLRASVRDKSGAVVQHAERLREALHKAGAADEAQAIEQILDGTRQSSAGKLVPSRVVRSRAISSGAVSYTHLDVYKRQGPNRSGPITINGTCASAWRSGRGGASTARARARWRSRCGSRMQSTTPRRAAMN